MTVFCRCVAVLVLVLVLLLAGAASHAGTYETVIFTDAEEAAVLDMANRATAAQITSEIGQTSTVANNVVSARPITTMAQLAAVPYVGTVAMTKFKAYVPQWTGATTPPPPPPPSTAVGGTYDGVIFSSSEEAAALAIANGSTLDALKAGGVAATPAGLIVNNRPWATLKAVSDLSGIATATMTALKNMAIASGATSGGTGTTPTATGGTYDGVVFTADQEAKALDICNKAGYSQMRSISGTARNIIYEKRPWTNLAAVANAANIGATAMTALKTMTASWSIGVTGKIDTVRMLKTAPPPLNTGVRIPKCRIVTATPGTNYIVISDSNDPAYTIKAFVPSTAPIGVSDPVVQWCQGRQEVSIYATYLEFPVGSGEKNLRWSNIFATHVTLP